VDRLNAWGDWLKNAPSDFIVYFFLYAITILTSLTLHEVAHGYVAYRCGDPTAKILGRVTLNPLKHLDAFGSLSILLLGFGWAKPVPVNPKYFRKPIQNDIAVSLAGITVNLIIFLFSLSVCVLLNSIVFSDISNRSIFLENGGFLYLFQASGYQGTPLLRYTNHTFLFYVQFFFSLMATINVSLGIFNLLPLPPLDGFHVVNDIVLRGRLSMGGKTFRIMQALLMVTIFTGVLNKPLGYLINTIYNGVLTALSAVIRSL